MTFSEIKVPDSYTPPKKRTLERAKRNYERGILKPLIVSPEGVLLEGFARYQFLKENNHSDQAIIQIGERIDKHDPTLRERLYSDADGRCYLCGENVGEDDFTIDHFISKANGGTNDYDNLRCCCLTCNRMKAEMRFDDFINKIKLIYRWYSKSVVEAAE